MTARTPIATSVFMAHAAFSYWRKHLHVCTCVGRSPNVVREFIVFSLSTSPSFSIIISQPCLCRCHPGFVGMRCEHADLLAVVASNHRQQTVATMLVLCVVGSVLLMLLCTLLK
ncbi:hypothetical protein cypCar_00016241 [Cyprinus carpio]|nr:hypothetical protein cypCar_00016241 [Cyprinus carpio]